MHRRGRSPDIGKVTLKGRVCSGRGAAGSFVDLPWARRQFKEKLGFDPWPGTLNLHLLRRVDISVFSDRRKGIRVTPRKGFCAGRCFRAQVVKVPAAVVVPDVPDYPRDLLEILAPVNLRELLGLKDGEDLKVTVWLDRRKPLPRAF